MVSFSLDFALTQSTYFEAKLIVALTIMVID